MTTDLTILGKTICEPSKTLETVPAPAHLTWVTLTSDEVTALCPVTGQPDYYTVTIMFRVKDVILESKSLKLYLCTFRAEGIFCEALAEQIAQDVVGAVKPLQCKVTVKQKSRGGISIEAEALWDCTA